MNILLILILQMLAFLPLYNVNFDNELISILFIGVNLSIVSIYLLRTTNNSIGLILQISLLVRILVMIIDLYTNFSIVHSGADSEDFHNIAISNSVTQSYSLQRTFFTDYLTTIYRFWGDQRLLAQYINVVFGLSALNISNKIFCLLDIPYTVRRNSMLVLCFFPTMIILSSILLRDMIVIAFTIYSSFYFIRWCISGATKDFFLTILNLVIGSIMHPGVILIATGYLIAYIVWNHNRKKTVITLKSIMSLIPVFLILIIIFAFPSLFMDKFVGMSQNEDIVSTISYEDLEAGSKYLSWINPKSVFHVILFTPLKVLYFYISPVPWEFRGVGDIISFILDSSLYVFLLYNIFRKIRRNNNLLIVMMFFSLIISSIAFAWGVVAAGTAMRHRVKLLVLLFIIYFVTNFKTTISFKN